MQNFQERLKIAIERSGKTKGSLAKSTGVALSTVSRWLAGAAPRVETIGEIAAFLGVDANWLSYGEERNSLQKSEIWGAENSTVSEDERPYRFTPVGPADPKALEMVTALLNRSPEEIAKGMDDSQLVEALNDWSARYLAESKSYLRAAIAGNLIVFSHELLRRTKP